MLPNYCFQITPYIVYLFLFSPGGRKTSMEKRQYYTRPEPSPYINTHSYCSTKKTQRFQTITSQTFQNTRGRSLIASRYWWSACILFVQRAQRHLALFPLPPICIEVLGGTGLCRRQCRAKVGGGGLAPCASQIEGALIALFAREHALPCLLWR